MLSNPAILSRGSLNASDSGRPPWRVRPRPATHRVLVAQNAPRRRVGLGLPPRLVRNRAEMTEQSGLGPISDGRVELRAAPNGIDEVAHVQLRERVIASRVQRVALLRHDRLLH